MAPLVLASRSPQRRAILAQLGIPFRVAPADVAERREGPAEEVALENARAKAAAVAPGVGPAPVLGVDTVVAVDGRLLGKPADRAEAAAHLERLAGREHRVVSGLVLLDADRRRETVAATRVRFRALDAATLNAYVAAGEWRERAGGYAIQGRGAALVAALEGDYSNVVGLPVAALLELAPELLQAAWGVPGSGSRDRARP